MKFLSPFNHNPKNYIKNNQMKTFLKMIAQVKIIF